MTVGIVFSPTLNIPAPVLAMFLNDFHDIFGSDPDDHSPTSPTTMVNPSGADGPANGSAASPTSSDDIRSPRKQMFQDLPTPGFNQPHHPFQQGFRGPAGGNHQNQPQGGPGTTSHVQTSAYDTGFIPMQPSYEQPVFGQDPYGHGAQGKGTTHTTSQGHNNSQGPNQAQGIYPGMPPPMNTTTIAGPEYGSIKGTMNVPTPSSPYMQHLNAHLNHNTNSSNGSLDPRDTKARRRESSMLMMGGGVGSGLGNRQSSMPQLRENTSRFALE